MDLVRLAQQCADVETQLENYATAIRNYERDLFVARMSHKVTLLARNTALKKLTQKRMEITTLGRVEVSTQAEVDQVFDSIKNHSMQCRVICATDALKTYATAKGLNSITIAEETAQISTIAAAANNQGGGGG